MENSKLMNRSDKEYMKMAMLKHEETFREQVYELHRLYQIQKMLMKDIAKNNRNNNPHFSITHYQPDAKQCLNLERPGPQSGGKCSTVYEIEDDQSHDLELTLGPKSYYHRKIKASGPSFSSSSTGSNNLKRSSSIKEELMSQQKWDLELPLSVSNQDRLNSPPWLFQALSLNMS